MPHTPPPCILGSWYLLHAKQNGMKGVSGGLSVGEPLHGYQYVPPVTMIVLLPGVGGTLSPKGHGLGLGLGLQLGLGLG